MGKALVIKDVSFQSNACDKVSFLDPVPCTGLTLSTSSATFEYIGETVTVTATTIPANTTDQIVWSSSDDDVATVIDGAITLIGLGSATIMATCGAATAAVEVSQSSAKIQDISKKESVICSKRSTEVPNMVLYTSSAYDIIGKQYDALDEYAHVEGGDSRGLQAILVPNGAIKVTLVTSNSSTPTFKCEIGDPINRTIHNDASYPTYSDASAAWVETQNVVAGKVIMLRLNHNTDVLSAITGVLFSAS